MVGLNIEPVGGKSAPSKLTDGCIIKSTKLVANKEVNKEK